MKSRIKLGFVGSREIQDQNAADTILYLVHNLYEIETVISGGANGPDKMGVRWARFNEIPFFEFYAEWDKYGKRAGLIRNGYIVNNINFLIAMWDGKSSGTHDTVTKAEKKGIPVILIQPIQSISFDCDSVEDTYVIVRIKGTDKYKFKKAMYVSRNGDIQLKEEPDVMHTYEACYVVYFNNVE